MSDYIKFNQERWNNVSRKKGNPYTLPLTPEEYFEAINNEIRVGLTVGKSVPAEREQNIRISLWWWTTRSYFCGKRI